MKRIIVAITGASGAIYGVRALQLLRDMDVETHVILTPSAHRTILHETAFDPTRSKYSPTTCTIRGTSVPRSRRDLSSPRACSWPRVPSKR